METPKKLDYPITEQWWKGKTWKTTQLLNNGGDNKDRKTTLHLLLMHLYKLLLQEKQDVGMIGKHRTLSINDNKRWKFN